MPIKFSSSRIAFTPVTGDGYQPTCVVLSLTHTLEASLVLLPPTANRLRIWIFKRWPSQLPSSRTFWWDFSWTSAWMARSSSRYALKIQNIFRFSYSNADWFTDHWKCQLLLLLQVIRPFPEQLFAALNQWKEKLVNISCALLMMGATTPETSLKLECYAIL